MAGVTSCFMARAIRRAGERAKEQAFASDGSATILLCGGEGIPKHRKLKT
jgi:hypothetical protein